MDECWRNWKKLYDKGGIAKVHIMHAQRSLHIVNVHCIASHHHISRSVTTGNILSDVAPSQAA
jgi:hypothetical protein